MGTRVQGGYEGYEVGMRGTRWVQGGYKGYEVGVAFWVTNPCRITRNVKHLLE